VSGLNVALVEFFAAIVPAWLTWKGRTVHLIARNGKPRSLLVLMHISGFVLLWLVWKLYEIETRPVESKK